MPRGSAAISASVPALFAPDAKAAARFFGFLTVNIRNTNMRWNDSEETAITG